MTSTVQVTCAHDYVLVQAYDVVEPGKRTLVTELVVDPGDVETVHVWHGRELVITEIRNTHPLVMMAEAPCDVEAA